MQLLKSGVRYRILCRVSPSVPRSASYIGISKAALVTLDETDVPRYEISLT